MRHIHLYTMNRPQDRRQDPGKPRPHPALRRHGWTGKRSYRYLGGAATEPLAGRRHDSPGGSRRYSERRQPPVPVDGTLPPLRERQEGCHHRRDIPCAQQDLGRPLSGAARRPFLDWPLPWARAIDALIKRHELDGDALWSPCCRPARPPTRRSRRTWPKAGIAQVYAPGAWARTCGPATAPAMGTSLLASQRFLFEAPSRSPRRSASR